MKRLPEIRIKITLLIWNKIYDISNVKFAGVSHLKIVILTILPCM